MHLASPWFGQLSPTAPVPPFAQAQAFCAQARSATLEGAVDSYSEEAHGDDQAWHVSSLTFKK